MPHTIVRNKSGAEVFCDISTGDGALTVSAPAGWTSIPNNNGRTENRTGWQLITFRNGANQRGGVYVDLTSSKLVEIHAFDKILVF